MKKRIISLFLLCAIIITCFAGCAKNDEIDVSAIPEEIKKAVSAATSVQTAVSVALQARVGTSASSSGHNASLGADITVTSTKDPFSYHGEYYSNILVDGVSTREDKEYYVVKNEDNNYIRYEYADSTGEWTKEKLSRADTMALPLKTCVIQNWDPFLSSLTMQRDPVSISNKSAYLFEGKVPAAFIQELVGDKVFGSFLFSVEQLLNDQIPCKAYFAVDTYLPIQIELDFTDSFIVNDMFIDSAVITANYSEWNEHSEIELPKKINIVASDETAKFYATYYAWNLFLPYINGSDTSGSGTAGNSGLSFTTSWETYQLRIDQGMTTLPITYESLHNLGYDIQSSYSSNILEPNSVIKDVPVMKGKDQILCSFYNPDTSPKPIIDCTIGCIDVRASGIVQNGISIYLPGEITLGVTRAALESAYGKPHEKTEGFSADTYVWNGQTEGQSFTAEISPVNDQVIRLRLENMPIVDKNAQVAEPTVDETAPDATVPETTSAAQP